MAIPVNLPAGALEALHAYLLLKVERPGRARLMPTGFENYGPSLDELANYVHPLMFDTGIDGVDYGIAGSCFLVRCRDQTFVITADHCLTDGNGNDVRIALNPVTKSFLPLKQLHRAQSNPRKQDWADVAVFEAAPEMLTAEEQRHLRVLNLDPLRIHEMRLKPDAKLVIPSFPKCLNEIDYSRFVIHTQRYLPSGNYSQATNRPGVHLMAFDEIAQIEHPDGMSGSPVFFIEEYPEAHHFGFLGMVIKASKLLKQAEFICAPVIFQMLERIISEKLSSPTS